MACSRSMHKSKQGKTKECCKVDTPLGAFKVTINFIILMFIIVLINF